MIKIYECDDKTHDDYFISIKRNGEEEIGCEK